MESIVDENITLYDWAFDGNSCKKNSDDLEDLFINMDKSMRYLHDHGYCVSSFNPYDIEIINGDINYVKFLKIEPISSQYSDLSNNDSIVRNNIFLLSCLQIGMYTNTILNKNYSPSFLKEHFEDFSNNLPSTYVPYYRGIIERSAGIYLSDFVFEKSNREYMDLQRQLSTDKSTEVESIDKSKVDLLNTTTNDKIYSDSFVAKKSINHREAAFARVLIYPSMILFCVLVIFVIMALVALFG